MDRSPLSRTAAGLLLLSLACNGPLVLLPGGALDGTVAAPPPEWSGLGDAGTAQLETRPADPYSVNVAYTVLGGRLYVNAGDTETRWVENIAEDPAVRLRIGETLYELRAERVSDEGEVRAFAKAWTDQSVFRRDPTGLERVYLYRLVAR